MCLGLLLGRIIKIKQATVPLGTKIPSNTSMKLSRVSQSQRRVPYEKRGLVQLDAGHSVDGTLPFEPKLNKLKETRSVTFRCDAKQGFSLQST